jgi:hypothetical protein
MDEAGENDSEGCEHVVATPIFYSMLCEDGSHRFEHMEEALKLIQEHVEG